MRELVVDLSRNLPIIFSFYLPEGLIVIGFVLNVE